VDLKAMERAINKNTIMVSVALNDPVDENENLMTFLDRWICTKLPIRHNG
jgi:hypothetical protein